MLELTNLSFIHFSTNRIENEFNELAVVSAGKLLQIENGITFQNN